MAVSIPMHPVKSSTIAAVGYDEDAKELYVEFLKGSVYKYSDVPYSEFIDFINSDSVGKYYLTNIQGKYSSTKVN